MKNLQQRKRIGGVWQDPASGVWRYRFMFNGKRYFGTCPTAKNKGEAKAQRDRRRIAVREGRDHSPNASTNFKKFVKDTFLEWVETDLSPSTYESYSWRCDDMIEEWGELDLSEISVFAIQAFKKKQLARKTKKGETQSPGSVNCYLRILQSIFTQAVGRKLIDREKCLKIELLKGETGRIRYLSADEQTRLLAAAAAWPHLYDLIVVDLATGLRKSELFGLRIEDVDLALNLVTVLGKGRKLRTIPLEPDEEARAILERRSGESRCGLIFPSPHSGDVLTHVNKSLAAAAAEAKVYDISLHTLRHTYCTDLAAAGVDIRTIQELAGHSDIKTTMKYVHLVDRNKHNAVRALKRYREGLKNCHEFTTEGSVVSIAKRA
jgi:site-specific recombinase XerD